MRSTLDYIAIDYIAIDGWSPLRVTHSRDDARTLRNSAAMPTQGRRTLRHRRDVATPGSIDTTTTTNARGQRRKARYDDTRYSAKTGSHFEYALTHLKQGGWGRAALAQRQAVDFMTRLRVPSGYITDPVTIGENATDCRGRFLRAARASDGDLLHLLTSIPWGS